MGHGVCEILGCNGFRCRGTTSTRELGTVALPQPRRYWPSRRVRRSPLPRQAPYGWRSPRHPGGPLADDDKTQHRHSSRAGHTRPGHIGQRCGVCFRWRPPVSSGRGPCLHGKTSQGLDIGSRFHNGLSRMLDIEPRFRGGLSQGLDTASRFRGSLSRRLDTRPRFQRGASVRQNGAPPGPGLTWMRQTAQAEISPCCACPE